MTSANNTPRSVLTRRNFVKGTLAMAAAGTFLPGCKHSSGSGSNTIPVPPDFPQSISLYQQTFINWARETIIPDVWFCSPANPEDVITVANWAKRHDYQLRPYGSGHGFAPTILPRGNSGRKVVLVNTSEYLNKITVDADSSVKTVTAQAGAYLEAICIELEKYDLGFYHTTAPGDVSIAGVLAMNAHGAALPATGETLQAGHSWGSLSNLILSITAVAWNDAKSEYELKTFQRDDPLIGPLLTCLARAFITEVTLQVGPNLKVRCQSSCNLKVDDLLDAPENNNPDSFANLSDTYGTVDILFYPFAPDGTAWVKTWTVTPTKPSTSREVLEPYNYHALAMTPEQADQLTKQLQANNGAWVPNYNELARNGIASLIQDTDPTTQVYDLWGSAYCTTLYVKPLTPRETVAAWGVMTSRANIQRVLHEFYVYFKSLIQTFTDRGLYPYAGPVELRAHGVDNPAEVLIANAVEPTISGPRPHPDYPERDVIIWFAINNNVDQPLASEFNTRLEEFFLSNYQSYAIVRPEWTKSYAFTADGAYGGAWTNTAILTETFPNTWRDGYPANDNWDFAVATLTALDPHRIFSNSHLDKLFPI